MCRVVAHPCCTFAAWMIAKAIFLSFPHPRQFLLEIERWLKKFHYLCSSQARNFSPLPPGKRPLNWLRYNKLLCSIWALVGSLEQLRSLSYIYCIADKLTKEQWHRCMSNIRCRDTRPELKVRHVLWHCGFRYSLNVMCLPGNPT